MNFLELAQALHRESGASGSGPTAVTSQSAENERFVEWVKLEYRKIENRHPNWRWLRKSFTFSATASDDSYAYGDVTDVSAGAVISRFSHWWPDTFRIYVTASGVGTQARLIHWDWDDFREIYKIGTQNEGTPVHVSIDPANNIVLGPSPSAACTVTGDFQRSNQTLSADSDTPEMPAKFHDLIWLGALRRYAAFESAPEVWAEAKSQYSEMFRSLEQDQLPKIRFGAPLA